MIFEMPNMIAWGAYFWKRWSPSNFEKHVYHSDATIEAACTRSGLELLKVFHFGPPMLRCCRWERNGVAPLLVTTGQVGVNVLGAVIPVYEYGHPRVSGSRLSRA
jgi:hypothetical protein